MVTGWRRAFCTSIPKEDQNFNLFSGKTHHRKKNTAAAVTSSSASSSPRISSKFGFFSTPSTPKHQPQSQPPVSSPVPNLRCRTAISSSATVPSSPRLESAPTTKSPRLLHLSSSNPTSPKSPSSFSLLRATFRLSRTRCGICLQSAKAGQGTAIFTAECSHTFHFPCVSAHFKKHRILLCPVCGVAWKELPLLDDSTDSDVAPPCRPNSNMKTAKANFNLKPLRGYDDDESLMSPCSISRFNPIPESDESNEDEPVEFQGFFVGSASSPLSPSLAPPRNNLEVGLLPESALVSVNKSFGTYAVVLKVKAPPVVAIGSPPRAPVDLVTVLDVSACMNGDKLHVMKRVMRLIISSLSDADRLSIVAFSATSKRLLPLRRMTVTGRRSARRIVDAIGCTGQTASVNDALRKAAKVLEERREKNPVATVMLLSDGDDHRIHTNGAGMKRAYPIVTSTRLGDFPVHAIGLGDGDALVQEEAFAKCLRGLLSVAVQDLKLQLGFVSGSGPAGEITAVYSLIGRPAALGSGLIRVGDLYAQEERELLVELKARDLSSGSRHVMSVGSSYKDPPTQELLYSDEQHLPIPRPQAVRSPSIQRLKNLHVTARAIAESRRLVERGDLSGAYHLLSSARALLVQSGLGSGDEFLRCLEAELTELQRARQAAQRQRAEPRAEDKPEPLTPTSAWRTAERLAKVAIMRKSMNKVSDLHGFENARF